MLLLLSWLETVAALGSAALAAFNTAVQPAPDIGTEANSAAELQMPVVGPDEDVGVGVGVGDGVGVGVGVDVGVAVGVRVGVGVGVGVGVDVGVVVGVGVAVDVLVGVGVGVGVGVAPPPLVITSRMGLSALFSRLL